MRRLVDVYARYMQSQQILNVPSLTWGPSEGSFDEKELCHTFVVTRNATRILESPPFLHTCAVMQPDCRNICLQDRLRPYLPVQYAGAG